MKILVIIVTYNAMQWVERCLGSVRGSIAKAETFIVDNGSTDGTQEYIKKQYPEVLFHQSSENLGFGRANNLGLQYALDNKYDYVYLLNQDAWIYPETLERLIELSKEYPEYGIISPFQMSADVCSIDKAFFERFRSWDNCQSITEDFYNDKEGKVYEVKSVMAAHWFLTRQCIEIVGGFSPTFPHYGEDDNFSDRARYKGMKVGVVPSLRVVHDRKYRKADNKKKMYLLYTDGLYRLSNPYLPFIKTFWKFCYSSCITAIKEKSFIPIKNIWRLSSRLKSIKENKRLSMINNCAFLRNNEIINS